MQLFTDITNAAINNEYDRPLMQKEIYFVSNSLQQYLEQNKNSVALPITYKELLQYEYTNAIKDVNGKHTHWEKVIFKDAAIPSLHKKLIDLYCILKQNSNHNNYTIQSLDFCEYANSMPFRVIIFNTQTTATDIFYIKSADASRLYGLELEHLLTNNTINFLYHKNTLVEKHIYGIAGDDFLQQLLHYTIEQKKIVAEEFIRFNERCFSRLLGDMRSYNFVVEQNKSNYIMRAIDFDQQCYEGKLNLYLPQFYKENYQYVQLVNQIFTNNEIELIRKNERKKIATLFNKNKEQLNILLDVMSRDELSENYKILSLKKQLNAYYKTDDFSTCNSMGSIVKAQLEIALHQI